MTASQEGLRSGKRVTDSFRLALTGVLLVCTTLYIFWTWHWPLVGDSSLMHYIAFLMDHGMAPYRDVADMNLPGSFLIEWLVMHTYGGGALAWRLFDLTVLLAMGAGLVAIAWPYDWFAGVFSAVLMMMIHGRDGIFDTGQRDLTMAALVVLGYAFLFRARRKHAALAAGCFGFCMAAAGTIKPFTLPLAALLFVLLVMAVRRDGHPVGKLSAGGLAGLLLPEVIVLGFLLRERALGAFLHDVTTLDPYFASLGRRPVGFLLLHSVSPLMPLVAVWAVLAIGLRFAHRASTGGSELWSVDKWERLTLLLGLFTAVAGFIVQGKGYPYQRYCFLVLLLLIMGLDLTRALRLSGVWRGLAWFGLGMGSLFLAPQSLAKVRRYDWQNQEYLSLMMTDLRTLGGTSLSGHLQCMDTIHGCSNAFYHLQLIPATGMLSDFLFFGSPDEREVRESRAAFWRAIQSSPPWIMVVTSPLFPNGPDDFQKLKLWPAFSDYLHEQYHLCIQRTPTRRIDWGGMSPQKPPSYRIYLLNAAPARIPQAMCEALAEGGRVHSGMSGEPDGETMAGKRREP